MTLLFLQFAQTPSARDIQYFGIACPEPHQYIKDYDNCIFLADDNFCQFITAVTFNGFGLKFHFSEMAITTSGRSRSAFSC